MFRLSSGHRPSGARRPPLARDIILSLTQFSREHFLLHSEPHPSAFLFFFSPSLIHGGDKRGSRRCAARAPASRRGRSKSSVAKIYVHKGVKFELCVYRVRTVRCHHKVYLVGASNYSADSALSSLRVAASLPLSGYSCQDLEARAPLGDDMSSASLVYFSLNFIAAILSFNSSWNETGEKRYIRRGSKSLVRRAHMHTWRRKNDENYNIDVCAFICSKYKRQTFAFRIFAQLYPLTLCLFHFVFHFSFAFPFRFAKFSTLSLCSFRILQDSCFFFFLPSSARSWKADERNGKWER